jgi:predicted O-methyltransferase YrrM
MGIVTMGIVTMGAEPAEKSLSSSSDKQIQAVIDEVEKACLEGPVYMIGPKKAQRLAELVRKRKPAVVVECGTALGYSGLWIARELKATGKGKLISVEISPQRAKQAEANFRKAGLEKIVTIKVGDARQVVKQIKGPIDFVFIDCGYANYLPCLEGLQKRLSRGAIVVADNVGIGKSGMKDYLEAVRSKYKSRTEWFDLELPWARRDAMEVSVVPD